MPRLPVKPATTATTSAEPEASTPRRRRRALVSLLGNEAWRRAPTCTEVGGGFGSSSILEECGPEIGYPLWRAYTDVCLWVSVAPGERAELFAAGIEASGVPIGSGMCDALYAIDAIRSGPTRCTGARVARACADLSGYAAAEGYHITAMLLAEAGTQADPRDLRLALRVGQLARRAADYVRTEPWLMYVVGRAERRGQWDIHCTAASALANLYWQRGNFPKARAWNNRMLEVAREHQLREHQAQALHALFVIESQAGNYPAADTYCRAAFELMGCRGEILQRLSHDIACSYVDRGYFSRATAILQALLPHFRNPDDRVLVWAALARAAGGLGGLEMYRQAAAAVVDLTTKSVSGHCCATALLDVAYGAAALKSAREAETIALTARTLARMRSEGEVEFRAEALITLLQAEFASESGARRDEEIGADPPDGGRLAVDLVRALGS